MYSEINMNLVKLLYIFLMLQLLNGCGSSKTSKNNSSSDESQPEVSVENNSDSGEEQFEEFDDVAESDDAETDENLSSEQLGNSGANKANSFVDEDEDLFVKNTSNTGKSNTNQSISNQAQNSTNKNAGAFDTHISEKSKTRVKLTNEIESYEVGENETLMWVSFKLYGDYRMWKNLAKLNKGILRGKGLISKGMTIKYKVPDDEFMWKKEGNPFLIKKGDTLGTISKDVYGVKKRWKEIWYNNRPMIVNPNIIFAGFTLYYIPDRDKVARLQ